MTELFERDTRGPRFLDASEAISPGCVVIYGAPYDGTTSFRPGTRGGPDALRDASVGLETYSPRQDADLLDAPFADLGNLEIGPGGAPEPAVDAVEAATRALLEAGCTPLMLGGEHSMTVGAVRAMSAAYPSLLVVQLDAHADLRDAYLGGPLSHACALRRCLEAPGVDALQVGIRSGTREEFAELRASARLVSPEPEALRQRLAAFPERPIYLTLDLDVFDPSVLPGTGTPEPGGIDWARFEALLDVIPSSRLVGADVVELAPNLDPSGCSSVVAAKAARELIIKLSRRSASR